MQWSSAVTSLSVATVSPAIAIRATGSIPSRTWTSTRLTADWEEGRCRGVVGSPYFFLGREGFFCPSLDIERVDGHLRSRSTGAASRSSRRARSTSTAVDATAQAPPQPPAAGREHPQDVAGAQVQRALVGEALGAMLVAGREEPVLARRSRTAAGQTPRSATRGAR